MTDVNVSDRSPEDLLNLCRNLGEGERLVLFADGSAFAVVLHPGDVADMEDAVVASRLERDRLAGVKRRYSSWEDVRTALEAGD